MSCVAYNFSDRVHNFNISGRNCDILLRDLKNLFPEIPEKSNLYFTDMPEKAFLRYGCWASEKTLEIFLPYFYKNKFTVNFIDTEKASALIKKSYPESNQVFIKFQNGNLYSLEESMLKDDSTSIDF